MKSVLFSVRPEWCWKIATGEKTIEVRKTVPKLPTPYKGYLYCTLQKRRKDARNLPISRGEMLRDITINGMKCMSKYANGKVWAEFVCDADMPLLVSCSDPTAMVTHYEVPGTCLSDVEIMEYLGNGVEGHGLHISQLTIYEKPRELSEFRRVCVNDLYCESCAMFNNHTDVCGNAALVLKRAPQSWCYVEELET